MKRLLLLITLIGIFIINYGIEKPKITVDLQIKEKGYVTHFSNDLPGIKRKCETQIIQYLNKEYGFVNFVNTSANYKLLIEIDIKERSLEHTESELQETGFFLTIQGIDGIVKPVYWKFKPESEYWDPLPENTAPFIFEIDNKFLNGLKKNSDIVIKNLLSNIPIVNEAFFEIQNSYWIIPVNKDSFRIDVNSEIIVENIISSSIFDDIKHKDTTLVYTHIKDMMAAHQELNVPKHYPKGSLVTRIVQQNNETLDNIDAAPSIYLIKYFPYVKPVNNGLIGTDEQFTSSNN